MKWLACVLAGWLVIGWISAGWAAEQPTPTSGQLLYSRLTNGTWQLWMTDLSTGRKTQLTDDAGDKRYPSWGADGAVIYHTSNYACYRVHERDTKPLLSSWWPARDVAWSPEGSQVAFARFRTDLVDSANIWVADADGANARMLTRDAGIQYNPSWSPDGRALAYVAGQGYGTYEVYVIDIEGGTPMRLTMNDAHEFLPSWSPDGSQIAFASDRSGDYEVWIMRSDGTGQRQLTHSPGLDTRPAWSPDGQWITFTSNRSGQLGVWVMRADGSDPQALEADGEGACDAAWRSG